MMPSADLDPTSSQDGDVKRHQLIDMIIKHQRDVQLKLMKRVQELKNDTNERLFVFRPYNAERKTFIINRDASWDMKIWKLCLMHAHVKLNIPIAYSHGDSTFKCCVENFATILDFLKPLMQRTKFIGENGGVSESLDHDCHHFENLLDCVVAKYNNETEALIADWEEMKFSQEATMSAGDFRIFRTEKEDKTGFFVRCESIKNYALWNSALSAAVSAVAIPEISIYALHFGNPDKTFGRSICGNMSATELGYVLKWLKPLAPMIQITYWDCYANVEGIDHFSTFFEEGSIYHLTIKIMQPEFRCLSSTHVLDFVRKVKPPNVYYRRQGPDTGEEDLLALADVVEQITIHRGTHQSLPLSVMRDILSRKCISLIVYDQHTVLSLTEAEKIIQFVHHQSKKVSVELGSIVAAIDAKVGEYIIKARPMKTIIEHMDMEEQFSRLIHF